MHPRHRPTPVLRFDLGPHRLLAMHPCPQAAQQRDIVQRRLLQGIGFDDASLEGGNRREVDRELLLQGRRELVAELAVVVWNAGDPLHEIAPRGALGVDQLEDGADQPAPPIVRQARHHLRPPEPKRHVLVPTGIAKQTGDGHQGARARVFHQCEVARPNMRMAPAEHVARPERYVPVQRRVGARPEHLLIESDHTLHIRWCGPPQHQSIAQLAAVSIVCHRLCCCHDVLPPPLARRLEDAPTARLHRHRRASASGRSTTRRAQAASVRHLTRHDRQLQRRFRAVF